MLYLEAEREAPRFWFCKFFGRFLRREQTEFLSSRTQHPKLPFLFQVRTLGMYGFGSSLSGRGVYICVHTMRLRDGVAFYFLFTLSHSPVSHAMPHHCHPLSSFVFFLSLRLHVYMFGNIWKKVLVTRDTHGRNGKQKIISSERGRNFLFSLATPKIIQ